MFVGNGFIEDVPELIQATCPAVFYAVICDENVAGSYGAPLSEALAISNRARLFTFPAGEAHKTRETWAGLTDAMVEAGVGRDGAIVAVGGGVSGDLGGFVAATYLRGIPYVQVPTSLLAMVDSSVGGKTGVDTDQGKNLVGAFHQPASVFADVQTLLELPDQHLRAGLAEAVKHGVIADQDYFHTIEEDSDRLLRREEDALVRLVARSIEIKSAVVQDDEKEAGKRSVLNFGHTIGHAIEAQSDFALLHGHAVAIGMVKEAELGVHLGITAPDVPDHLSRSLGKLGLPTEMPGGFEIQGLLDIIRRDKKNRSSEIHLSLPTELGIFRTAPDGTWTRSVSEDAIKLVLS